MAEDGKKSNLIAQIAVGMVLAICVGGSSPWWLKELKELASDSPAPVQGSTTTTTTPQPINDQLASLDKSDLANRQKQLEDELAALRNEQRQQSSTRPTGVPDISGDWQSGLFSYKFYQRGSSLTFEEISPVYGQTAVGEGTISGQNVSLTVQNALGVQGTLNMTLSDDGQELNGTITDAFGNATAYTLTR